MTTMTETVDYGPLAGLIGTWAGDRGLDVAPEPDGPAESPYYETIVFEAVGQVENAETQVLAALRYHQVVRRKSDDEVFHNETGYWMWDAAAGMVMHSLTIPRAVCVLAGGAYSGPSSVDEEVTLEVRARLGDESWGIVQSPFMRDNARTVAFDHRLTIGEGRLAYSETTVVEIYERTFEHTDANELTRRS